MDQPDVECDTLLLILALKNLCFAQLLYPCLFCFCWLFFFFFVTVFNFYVFTLYITLEMLVPKYKIFYGSQQGFLQKNHLNGII